jgi:hypothetical protein
VTWLRSFLIVSLLARVVAGSAQGQGLENAVEELPIFAASLAEVLGSSGPFIARAEAQWTHRQQSQPTRVAGLLAVRNSDLRWDLDTAKLESPFFPSRARTLLRQSRAEPLVLLARPATRSTSLLLRGAKAALESPLPTVRRHRRTTLVSTNEFVNGVACRKERLELAVGPDVLEVHVWKAAQSKQATPLQVRIRARGAIFLLNLRAPRKATLAAGQFAVPNDFERFTSAEDLAQSVLWDSVTPGFLRR